MEARRRVLALLLPGGSLERETDSGGLSEGS